MKAWILAVALGAAAQAHAQSTASRITTAQDRALMTRLIIREADRLQLPDRDARVMGLRSANAYIRAFTVRGMGRDENPSVYADLANALSDVEADVRSAAADALAQSVAGPLPANANDSARARRADEIGRVRDVLSDRLLRERDAAVRGAVLEAVGRLPQGSVQQVKATATSIAPSLSASSIAERRGAIR